MTTNEAAERLRHTQRVNFRSEEDVDLALAEERRHVIEQINDYWDSLVARKISGDRDSIWIVQEMNGYFDDLSTPEQKR